MDFHLETCRPVHAVHSHSTHHMVLHLVGVGLGDEQDITLKGLNALKRCSKIYLEAYTSVLTVPKEQLEVCTHTELLAPSSTRLVGSTPSASLGLAL